VEPLSRIEFISCTSQKPTKRQEEQQNLLTRRQLTVRNVQVTLERNKESCSSLQQSIRRENNNLLLLVVFRQKLCSQTNQGDERHVLYISSMLHSIKVRGVFRLRNVNIVGFYYLFNCYMFRSYAHLQVDIFSRIYSFRSFNLSKFTLSVE
jgi:hypothetical protein